MPNADQNHAKFVCKVCLFSATTIITIAAAAAAAAAATLQRMYFIQKLLVYDMN